MKEFDDAILEAHMAELKRQNKILSTQVIEMRKLIETFPSQLISARLDARAGTKTKYNYRAAAKACEIRVI